MKKTLSVCAAVCLAASSAVAQDFLATNFSPGVVDAPVFNTDGTTGLDSSAMFEVWVGGAVVASGTFFDGAGAGYFNGGQVTAGDAGATVQAQVRAWTGAASYDAATVRGESALFDQVLGGGGTPPAAPGAMANFQSFSLVPEPSTIFLGLLGAGALFLRRFRK